VHLSDAAYDVIVAPGVLTRAGEEIARALRLAGVAALRKLPVVVDARLPSAILDRLLASMPTATPIVARLPGGEENKTLARVGEVLDVVLSGGIDRRTPLVALGGGITGDLGGFVAAAALRGIPLVQVPTSLLAMVDSSVGGKVGVNHGRFKNMVGAFKHPAVVLIDPTLLNTLPDNELRSGLAECVKHAVIRDARLFEDTAARLDGIFARDTAVLSDLIARSVAIKARVVQADPYEAGERMHLNFGHTFAHAIETVSRHAIAHGPAVALGMVAACVAAEQLGMIDSATRARVTDLLARIGLPTRATGLPTDAVMAAMAHDKKASDGRVKLVLPMRIGAVTVRDDVPAELIRGAVESIR
jgi:3-dehydroquinate synthase